MKELDKKQLFKELKERQEHEIKGDWINWFLFFGFLLIAILSAIGLFTVVGWLI